MLLMVFLYLREFLQSRHGSGLPPRVQAVERLEQFVLVRCGRCFLCHLAFRFVEQLVRFDLEVVCKLGNHGRTRRGAVFAPRVHGRVRDGQSLAYGIWLRVVAFAYLCEVVVKHR